jgi:hypothetical protein
VSSQGSAAPSGIRHHEQGSNSSTLVLVRNGPRHPLPWSRPCSATVRSREQVRTPLGHRARCATILAASKQRATSSPGRLLCLPVRDRR